MKAQLLQLKARLEALSLRERAMVFAATAAVIVFAGHALVLAPMFAEQAALRTRIAQQIEAASATDAEIAAKVQAFQVDPDAASRARLNGINQELGQLGQQLLAIEHGLVPPERIAPLLESIMRANGKLKLVSVRTLPVEPLSGPPGAAATQAAAAAPAAAADPAADATPLLYRHGVELTVRGNYLDMVDTMSALEALPTRMFWGRAQLDVEEYPAARLTLTLHTLSLDRQWMKL
jgi:MSHA biogenesis protein MshJ